MSAELLRRAAVKLRDHAETATAGPWFAAPNRSVSAGKPLVVASVAGRELWPSIDDAEYIALMSPPVALALAELLETVAGIWVAEHAVVNYTARKQVQDDTVAIAREILREPQP